MKFLAVAPVVTLATAFLIPELSLFRDLAIHDKPTVSTEGEDWDIVLPVADHFSEQELLDFASANGEESNGGRPHHGHGHGHGHHTSNHSSYELLTESKYTHVFGYLLKHYASKDVVSLLNGTDHNVTVFAPLDSGFRKLKEHWKQHHGDKKPKKPSNETIEKFIEYHLVKGFVPAKAALWKSTLPTLLQAGKELNKEPQRLRIRFSIFGVNVNFFSRVRYGDIRSENGLLHGLSLPLFPPPPVDAIIEHLPTVFSTLLLAIDKSGIEEDWKTLGKDRTGLTIFAPTNKAWEWLGVEANAFLFSPRGKKYLNALLKYHTVVNQTLYTDHLNAGKKDSRDMASLLVDAATAEKNPIDWDMPSSDLQLEGEDSETDDFRLPGKHYHIDLPTILDDKPVGVDVGRWLGFIRVRVNQRVPVVVTDVIASDGVIQVVNRILIPPCHHGSADAVVAGANIDVEELKERLEPLLESEKSGFEGLISQEL